MVFMACLYPELDLESKIKHTYTLEDFAFYIDLFINDNSVKDQLENIVNSPYNEENIVHMMETNIDKMSSHCTLKHDLFACSTEYIEKFKKTLINLIKRFVVFYKSGIIDVIHDNYKNKIKFVKCDGHICEHLKHGLFNVPNYFDMYNFNNNYFTYLTENVLEQTCECCVGFYININSCLRVDTNTLFRLIETLNIPYLGVN
jgi:hypothetical protein